MLRPACAGHLLSLTSVPQAITLGSSSPLKLTLGGIPAYFLPVQLNGLTQGDSAVNGATGFTIYGKNVVVGELTAKELVVTNSWLSGPDPK